MRRCKIKICMGLTLRGSNPQFSIVTLERRGASSLEKTDFPIFVHIRFLCILNNQPHTILLYRCRHFNDVQSREGYLLASFDSTLFLCKKHDRRQLYRLIHDTGHCKLLALRPRRLPRDGRHTCTLISYEDELFSLHDFVLSASSAYDHFAGRHC